MKTEMSSLDFRKLWPEALNKALYQGDRTVITRNGKPIAVVVPLGDLETLEKEGTL